MFGRKAKGLFNRKCWKVKGKAGKVKVGKVRVVTVNTVIEGFLTLGVKNPSIRGLRKSSFPKNFFKALIIFKIFRFRGELLGSNKMLQWVLERVFIEGFLTLRVKNPPIHRLSKPEILRENPRLKSLNIFNMFRTLQVVHLTYHLVGVVLF